MATQEQQLAELLQMTNELKDVAQAGATKADLDAHKANITSPGKLSKRAISWSHRPATSVKPARGAAGE